MEHYYGTIPGWFGPQGAQFYQSTLHSLPEHSVIVEVGVWKGRSLSILLVEAINTNRTVQIIGVDHFQGSENEPELCRIAGTENIQAICRSNLDRAGYPYELRIGPSPVVAETFLDQSIDFCFLDGSHTYEAVRADIRAWWPKIRSGGKLAGHDAGHDAIRDAVMMTIGPWTVDGECWWVEKE